MNDETEEGTADATRWTHKHLSHVPGALQAVSPKPRPGGADDAMGVEHSSVQAEIAELRAELGMHAA